MPVRMTSANCKFFLKNTLLKIYFLTVWHNKNVFFQTLSTEDGDVFAEINLDCKKMKK